MDKEKLIAGVVGGIVAGFSIGVGFMIAQKTMGRFFNKQQPKNENADVADAVAKGVTEGVKQAKVEEDAANFSAMNAAAQKNHGAGGDALAARLGKAAAADLRSFETGIFPEGCRSIPPILDMLPV